MQRSTSAAAAMLATVPIAAACWLLYRSIESGPPIVVVDQPSQRIVARDQCQVTATYQIMNKGGRDLILGDATTTCGCSIASIPITTIKSGETGSIEVKGQPPDAGERVVGIEIETNAEVPKIKLSLTMESRRTPPFVITSSGAVRLGVIRPNSPPETIVVSTQEPQGKPQGRRTMNC